MSKKPSVAERQINVLYWIAYGIWAFALIHLAANIDTIIALFE
jgi:hypothetical protein